VTFATSKIIQILHVSFEYTLFSFSLLHCTFVLNSLNVTTLLSLFYSHSVFVSSLVVLSCTTNCYIYLVIFSCDG